MELFDFVNVESVGAVTTATPDQAESTDQIADQGHA